MFTQPAYRLLSPFLATLSLIAAGADSGAVRQTKAPGEQALFQEMPVVEAATLHTQTLEEAPANVTVISAADIRKYGYRTLGEALANVRGFDVTYDRIYHYVGVHGFSLPGDYNTRFLVMLNGHPLTENVFGSANFFAQDFGLDMDLVERIEIVRGPSSALYGSNGIFATINIVTQSPVDQPVFRATTETGSFGEKKAMVSSALYLGKGANLLVSVAAFHNRGQTHYFPEFDRPETNYGMAEHLDGERGYHTFANLIWQDWNFTAYFNSREKQPPMNWEAFARFDHGGARVQDRRNFLSLSRTKPVGTSGKLRWRLTYDQYRYDDRFFYDEKEAIQDFRNVARGDWAGAYVTYSVPVSSAGRFTVGAQANVEFRNLQNNFAVAPAYEEQLRVSRPDRLYGLFAQQEWTLSRRWTALLGLRFDTTHHFGHFASPRLALVHQRSPKSVYKFVYGHSFRNPTAFEQYYTDGLSYLPSPPLRPETAHTFEGSVERKLRRNLSGIVTGYDFGVNDIIQSVLVNEEQQVFQNISSAHSRGVEFELTGQVSRRLETTASLALQDTKDGGSRGRLVNSPRTIGKLRVAVPLIRDRLYLSSGVQYLSARYTRANELVRPVTLADFTVTCTRLLHPSLGLQFGLRNLADRVYYDPVALALDRMRGDGRSAFVKVTWLVRE